MLCQSCSFAIFMSLQQIKDVKLQMTQEQKHPHLAPQSESHGFSRRWTSRGSPHGSRTSQSLSPGAAWWSGTGRPVPGSPAAGTARTVGWSPTSRQSGSPGCRSLWRAWALYSSMPTACRDIWRRRSTSAWPPIPPWPWASVQRHHLGSRRRGKGREWESQPWLDSSPPSPKN